MKITNRGITLLNQQLAELEVRKQELSLFVAHAREYGDLRENAEYTTALAEIQRVETNINSIRSALLDVEIISVPENKNIISIGATVTLLDIKANKIVIYTIVSQLESDFSKGLISDTSPFAQSLIGLELNTEVLFRNIAYLVTDIQYNT